MDKCAYKLQQQLGTETSVAECMTGYVWAVTDMPGMCAAVRYVYHWTLFRFYGDMISFKNESTFCFQWEFAHRRRHNMLTGQ